MDLPAWRLQNNYITSLRGLEQLHSLQKLYLEGNSLARVERLGALRRLRELHLSRQLLPEGQAVEFDGDCLQVRLRTVCPALAVAHLVGMCVLQQPLPGRQDLVSGGDCLQSCCPALQCTVAETAINLRGWAVACSLLARCCLRRISLAREASACSAAAAA